jgi:hypothetical protein
MWNLAVAVTTYISICIVLRILPSFVFAVFPFLTMWNLDVAVTTYVSICIVLPFR